MWPERGEALSRTIDAEAAIADLYAEALRRWAPTARAAVLPSLTAAGVNNGIVASTLPPDPDAVAQTQTAWEQHAEEVILAGLLMLWAVTYVEAAAGLGIELALPDLDLTHLPTFDKQAVSIVARTTDATAAEVRDWTARVQQSAPVRATVTDFVDAQRPALSAVPGAVREQLAAVEREAEALAIREPGGRTPEELVTAQRDAAAAALDPSSPEMRDLARREGYQAAGVMNHAVLAAAAQQNADLPADEREELDKVWIATVDGKTRPTHWAADGQRAPLAGKFTIGGEQMDFPGDPSASAAERMNCRCRVGVLAVDEAIPDEVDRHTERLNGRDSVAINRDGRTQAEEIDRRREAGNIRARDDEDGIGRVASGGWAAPSEQEHDMPPKVKPSDLAAKTTTLADDTSGDEETYLTFTDALFAVTGVPTSDGRMLASDINLTFRDTPMPLQWCEKMEGGHYGSVTVGVIESITLKNGEVRGSGYMLNNDNALKSIDVVSHGVCNPSVDLSGDDFEMVAAYEDGTVVTEENYDPDRKIYATTIAAEVTATTIVAIPAFGETRIALNEEREQRDKALVASAAESFRPRMYDPQLFADPKLTGPTALTVTEDGHVFGHIACFGECHRSIQSECIMAPKSPSNYAQFHTSNVHLVDGSRMAVGRLTVATGHAPDGPAGPAIEHYDNTGTCFALVRAGEDAHGIFVSGIVAPWATPEQVEMGLSAPISGDWRTFNGRYDLVAALAVNTPGFLVRSTADSLVASLAPSPSAERGGIEHYSLDDIRNIVMEAVAEERRTYAQAQRQATVFAQAHELVGDPPPELTPNERVAQLLALARY